MSNIQEAERMLDLFTSVGARSFFVTKLDVEQKHIWGKLYSAAELRGKLPAMVRTAADRKPYYTTEGKIVSAGENLIIRPTGDVAFVQLDDLTAEQLDRVRPASFLIIATSPGNHQAWIAVSGVEKSDSKQLVRRVRKAVGGVDKSASGATRVAGTENFKVKYWPDYPTVAILHGIPGRVMTGEQLRDMGLLATPEPTKFAADKNVTPSHSPPLQMWQEGDSPEDILMWTQTSRDLNAEIRLGPDLEGGWLNAWVSEGVKAWRPQFERRFAESQAKAEASGEPAAAPPTKEVLSHLRGPYPRRAAWLATELALRNWNVHDLEGQQGPNWKTSRKVLDGLPVSRSVLEKTAAALSSPKKQVLLKDIPID